MGIDFRPGSDLSVLRSCQVVPHLPPIWKILALLLSEQEIRDNIVPAASARNPLPHTSGQSGCLDSSQMPYRAVCTGLRFHNIAQFLFRKSEPMVQENVLDNTSAGADDDVDLFPQPRRGKLSW